MWENGKWSEGESLPSVNVLGDSITVYLDPVRRRAFPLRVISVMSTRVFSNLITKCHQQEQAEGKKINYVIIHLTRAIIHAPCVFFHVFVSDSWAPSSSN